MPATNVELLERLLKTEQKMEEARLLGHDTKALEEELIVLRSKLNDVNEALAGGKQLLKG